MTTPALTTPAASNQAVQSALAASLSAQVTAAWEALLDVQALQKTLPVLSAGIAALVQQHGSASAGAAAQYYDAARLAAGVKGSYTVIPAQPAGYDQVSKSVAYTTKGLWSATPDVQAARTLTVGTATRMTLDAGRNTVIGAVRGDRKATGWMRVTRPGCCYFCAMLASRGAVYRAEQTADFQAHDHDQCTAAPVFGPYRPTEEVRSLSRLWHSSTRGTSGADAIKAFRQAYEGRDSGPAQGDSTPHGG